MSSSSDSENEKWIPFCELSKQSSHANNITNDNLKSNANTLNQRSYTYSKEVSQTYYFDENIDRKTFNLKNGDVKTTPSVKVDTDFETILFEDTQMLKHNDDSSSNDIDNVLKTNMQVDSFKGKKEEMADEMGTAQAAVGFSFKKSASIKKIKPRKKTATSGFSSTYSPLEQNYHKESPSIQASKMSELTNQLNDKTYSDFSKMVSLNAEKTVRTSTENPKYCVNDIQSLQTRTYKGTNRLPAVNKSVFSSRFTADSESDYKRGTRPLSMSTTKVIPKKTLNYSENKMQFVPLRKTFKYCQNHTIYLTQADITTLPVDVIIVSAFLNEGRQCMKKGLAKSVDDAALRSGNENFQLKVNTNGKMPTIIATAVDHLPYKMVIHAIVEMSEIRVNQSSFVEERITESLTRANIHSYSSVAIPGLFSAIDMHLADSTEFLIIDAVRKYFEISCNSSVKDIYFCDVNEKKLDKLQTTLPSVYSKKVKRHFSDANIYDKQYENTGNREVIQFCVGDITRRKVDIIVNVLGNELNLKDGTLSKSIAIKAGQEVFTELRKQTLVDKKDFIVTEGGRLFCKKIIHGILRHWDKPFESKRALQYFMQHCLVLAESMNKRSIAFPAVGTGLHKFPPDVVASEMFSQAQSFSSSSLTTIEFVICQDNMDVIRPFEAEMKKYLKDQTVRNKLSLHSTKPDDLSDTTSLLQSRESRSHINIRGEQNDQFENVLQYRSPNRRYDSSVPLLKYEANAPLVKRSADHHLWKNASGGPLLHKFIVLRYKKQILIGNCFYQVDPYISQTLNSLSKKMFSEMYLKRQLVSEPKLKM